MAQIRRYIYEYYRYNPQLGTSTRTGEVYETTFKKAERTAKRHCDDYTTYGSLSFKRIVSVSEPIVLGVDVVEHTSTYGDWPNEKKYVEFKNTLTNNHSDGWYNLTEV